MIGVSSVEIIIRSLIKSDKPSVLKEIDYLIKTNANKKNIIKKLTSIKDFVFLHDNTNKIYSQATTMNTALGKNNGLWEIISPQFGIDDIILNNIAKKQINDFIKQREHREILHNAGVPHSNRLLFYGLPGTGKTKLANGIAHQLKKKLMLVRLDELISSYLGKTGKNIKSIFEEAKNNNLILFFDEIDTIAKSRSDSFELGELKRVVTVFLQNLDLCDNGIIIIGATNHPDMVDKALWRRFDYHINFDLPNTEKEITQMINLFLGKSFTSKLNNNIIKMISLSCVGLTGDQIERIINEVKKKIILNKLKIEDHNILMNFIDIYTNIKPPTNKDNKQSIYGLLKNLKDKHYYSYSDLTKISSIPISTLRDNLNK